VRDDVDHRFLDDHPFAPRRARIVVEPISLRPRSVGPATGEIWLEVGPTAFPGKGWNDFILLVLGGWLESARRLADGRSEHEAVHFIEGPFCAELEAPSSAEWTVRLVDRASDKKPSRERIDPESLIRSLIDAVDAVIGASASRDVPSELIARLVADRAALLARLAAGK
jgi:hypothetical protein